MTLEILKETYAVCRLNSSVDVVPSGDFMSLTVTENEVSLVCAQDNVPQGCTAERGWKAMCIADALDFSMVGVLAQISGALADAGISIFAVSTYDTDYILVKEESLTRAVAALKAQGHVVAQS